MKIKLNGEVQQIETPDLTVDRLLKIKNVESVEMVSVQVNDEIIDRDNYETTLISENDEIEFLYFVGGGALKMNTDFRMCFNRHAT